MRRKVWRGRWDREKSCVSLFLHDELVFFFFMGVRYLVCARKPGITVVSGFRFSYCEATGAYVTHHFSGCI